MTARLRLVEEQVRDAEGQIQELTGNTAEAVVIREVTEKMYRKMARDLRAMFEKAPAVVLANRANWFGALDDFIRAQLTETSEYRPAKQSKRKL